MANIDPALLGTLITHDRGRVQTALDRVNDGLGIVMPLDVFEITSAKPIEIALIDYLKNFSQVDKFIATLSGLGEEIALENSVAARLTIINKASFDHDKLSAFAHEANAFRCRIRVNGEIKGSGVMVSHRLVLTAWHVVNREQPWDEDAPPRIEVITSDGREVLARPSRPSSPCHPEEWNGTHPNNEDLCNHNDFTLLRLAQPAGFALGFAPVTCPPPTWAGTISCLLVHYPLGADVGVTDGKAFFGDHRPRYVHDAPGDGGSSGGALFSNTFTLIGVHQKRVGEERLFVPLKNFVNDNSRELVNAINADKQPSYLWSLDGSLDGHLIIGRRTFFDALDHMLENEDPGSKRLRGVWMRRKRADEDQSGLGFAFDLLKAFLMRRQPKAHLVRISLRAREADLFTLVEAAFDNIAGASAARAGVREDETTEVAFEADRADALVRRIENSIAGSIWVYIDGPKKELSESVVRQLEQLLSRMQRSARIRFVVTRMESHHLPLGRFESLSEISERSPPGVMYDYTGDFVLEDVKTTIRAASADLELGLDDNGIDDIANKALIGIEPQFGRFPASKLSEVARYLETTLSERLEAA